MIEYLQNMLSQIPMITIVDYFCVTCGVVVGTLFAIKRKMDTLGAVALGLVMGFCGGIIRDLLLQDQGIFFMQHPAIVLSSCCISVTISLMRRHLMEIDNYLFRIDAFSMAWFVLAGASKSWFAGSGAVISVILGFVTAVGGGVLRDICVHETPRVFLPGKFYGISSVVAAIVYVVTVKLGVPQIACSALCIAVGYFLTVLSERFNWHTRAY